MSQQLMILCLSANMVPLNLFLHHHDFPNQKIPFLRVYSIHSIHYFQIDPAWRWCDSWCDLCSFGRPGILGRPCRAPAPWTMRWRLARLPRMSSRRWTIDWTLAFNSCLDDLVPEMSGNSTGWCVKSSSITTSRDILIYTYQLEPHKAVTEVSKIGNL